MEQNLTTKRGKNMFTAICSIFALVLGFCAGLMRSLETPEVKRLNKLYWDTQYDYDQCHEELEALKYEHTKVKLELLKAKSKERESKCQIQTN